MNGFGGWWSEKRTESPYEDPRTIISNSTWRRDLRQSSFDVEVFVEQISDLVDQNCTVKSQLRSTSEPARMKVSSKQDPYGSTCCCALTMTGWSFSVAVPVHLVLQESSVYLDPA